MLSRLTIRQVLPARLASYRDKFRYLLHYSACCPAVQSMFILGEVLPARLASYRDKFRYLLHYSACCPAVQSIIICRIIRLKIKFVLFKKRIMPLCRKTKKTVARLFLFCEFCRCCRQSFCVICRKLRLRMRILCRRYAISRRGGVQSQSCNRRKLRA